jgi:AraC-like DNA-binding protein
VKRAPLDSTVLFGFAGYFGEPGVMGQAHQHQELEMNFVTRGTVTYLVGGEICRVSAGRLTLLWAAAPHQVIAVEKDSRFYWFTLPFAWVLQWRLPRAFMNHLLRGRLAWEEDGKSAENCHRWLEDLKSGDEARLRAAQLEMEACLLRLASGRGWKRGGRETEGGAAGGLAIQKMLEVVARRYTESLSVEDVARPTGLHPNYASALFRRILGVTISDYVKQHRLFHARRLLTVTDKKIVDVALESGFGAPSRFYEAFVKTYGCAPRTIRRQMRL